MHVHAVSSIQTCKFSVMGRRKVQHMLHTSQILPSACLIHFRFSQAICLKPFNVTCFPFVILGVKNGTTEQCYFAAQKAYIAGISHHSDHSQGHDKGDVLHYIIVIYFLILITILMFCCTIQIAGLQYIMQLSTILLFNVFFTCQLNKI